MTNQYYERFEKFRKLLANRGLDFNIKYKDESLFMKILGYLLFFNKGFMSSYTTVIGNTVYFPTRKTVEQAKSDGCTRTLAHEAVHRSDSKGIKKIWFYFLYLFPQILFPFMWLLVFLNFWLAFVLFWVFMLPLPAPGRMHYELRGYKMTVLVASEQYKEMGLSDAEREERLRSRLNIIDHNFTGFGYYLMWPFGVEKQLNSAVDDIMSDNILEDETYAGIIEDFRNSKTQ